MEDATKSQKPILFACAGCSFAGRLAYDLAQELDRRGIAEMSCLAGVAANKPSFLRKLKGREVWLIDGCPIECGGSIFEQLEDSITHHIRLADFGIRKKGPLPDGVDMEELIHRVLEATSPVDA